MRLLPIACLEILLGDGADRIHVRRALERKVFSVGEYIMSRTGSRTPAFAFACPVLGPDRQLKGVLTAAIRLADFADFYDVSNLPDKSFVPRISWNTLNYKKR